MNNCWNWSKDVFLELGFYNGNHFRGNSGPHMRWMVASTRSCFETLTTFFLLSLYTDSTWAWPNTASQQHRLDNDEGISSAVNELLLPPFSFVVDDLVRHWSSSSWCWSCCWCTDGSSSEDSALAPWMVGEGHLAALDLTVNGIPIPILRKKGQKRTTFWYLILRVLNRHIPKKVINWRILGPGFQKTVQNDSYYFLLQVIKSVRQGL